MDLLTVPLGVYSEEQYIKELLALGNTDMLFININKCNLQ